MTTIGDVLAIIASLIGIGLTSWAFMVCCALLVPAKVQRARAFAETSVRTNFAVGILMLVPILAGVAMLGAPNPALKGVGWILLLSIFSAGAIGMAGLGYLASDTLRRMAPEIPEYAAFLRGSGFLVTASMLPVLGWFVFAPCLLLTAFGGGMRAIFGRELARDETFRSSTAA